MQLCANSFHLRLEHEFRLYRLVAFLLQLAEPPFSHDCGSATEARSGDGLPESVVVAIARRKDARNACPLKLVNNDVALLVKHQLPLKKLGVGFVTDSEEETVKGQNALFARLDILQPNARHFLVAQNFRHDAVPDELNFGVAEGSLLHDFAGTKLVAPVDDIDLAGVMGQIEGFFHCAVTATDDSDNFSSEEPAITSRAC